MSEPDETTGARRDASELLARALRDARGLRLDDDVVRARVDDHLRVARATAPSRGLRRWWPALIGGVAVAAAIALVVVRPAPPAVAQMNVVDIGPRVAIAARPGATYRVIAATADATEIAVVSGEVTARLYPGAAPHRLRVTAGALEAVATGTIFTVGDSAAPYVAVHEGHVEVRDASGARSIAAGAAWPARAIEPATTAAAQQLAAHAREIVRVVDAGIDDASRPDASLEDPRADASTDAAPPDAAHIADGAEDRWRRARQLRGQGNPRAAIEILDELVRRGDRVWSPIALAEVMRIQANVLDDPRAAIELGERFLARYPDHALRREVTDLLCAAHRTRGDTALPSACLIRE